MLIPVIDMKQTGKRIEEIRTQRGISVRELQNMLGFATPQAIYKWQRGETLPTLENLVALAFVLGVDIGDILVAKCDLLER